MTSPRKPWAGETPCIPTRVNGQRIVAAIKLASGINPHQWAVVVEIAEAEAYAPGVVTLNRSGLYDAELGTPCYSYSDAITHLNLTGVTQ